MSNVSKAEQTLPPIRAVKMGLFPTLNNIQSVVELGYSQLPITGKNELLGLLMTLQNTLLKEVNDKTQELVTALEEISCFNSTEGMKAMKAINKFKGN